MICQNHKLCYNKRQMEQKTANKLALDQISGVLCHVLWGLLPLYWHLLNGVSPLVTLACRILFSAAFTVTMLLLSRRFGEVTAVLRDFAKMRRMAPAALLIAINWGVYIWAATSGHVLDASIGYYLNPLVVCAIGMGVFHERLGALEYVALAVAAAGVLIATIAYGAFPWVALVLAFSFAIYGMFKKLAGVGGLVSTAVESLLSAPFALAFLLFAPVGRAAAVSLTTLEALLLLGSGVVTAVPLILYARGVNALPFTTMGFLQFVSPTLQLLIGALVLAEPMTHERVAAFVCSGAALMIYLVGLALRARKNRAQR